MNRRRFLYGSLILPVGALATQHARAADSSSANPENRKSHMRKYKVVDAFSSVPFKGNPVAVVLDAEGLTDQEMQAIARWTNLSETTFVLPPTTQDADYRLRIFAPQTELPFAGHPTLGSAHAVLEAGIAKPHDGVIIQECRQGLIRVAVSSDKEQSLLTLDLPPAKVRPLEKAEQVELEAIIGHPIRHDVQPAIVDVGAVWIIAQIEDVPSLLKIEPDFARLARFERKLGITGTTLFAKYGPGGPADIEVRSFAPSCGANEDPVCGSGNGSVAVFRSLRGQMAQSGGHYSASQGQKLGRNGRIQASTSEHGVIRIGGECVTCVDGLINI
jgi:PhzF family phenazine biosynthesis protein